MNRRITHLILALLGLFLIYWASKPSALIAYDKSCNLVDLQPRFSELIYGDTFWELQLALTDESLSWLQRAPANDMHGVDNEDRNFFEERMSRLSDRQQAGGQSADEAHLREEKQRYEQIAWLSSCDAVIRLRLRQ